MSWRHHPTLGEHITGRHTATIRSFIERGVLWYYDERGYPVTLDDVATEDRLQSIMHWAPASIRPILLERYGYSKFPPPPVPRPVAS